MIVGITAIISCNSHAKELLWMNVELLEAFSILTGLVLGRFQFFLFELLVVFDIHELLCLCYGDLLLWYSQLGRSLNLFVETCIHCIWILWIQLHLRINHFETFKLHLPRLKVRFTFEQQILHVLWKLLTLLLKRLKNCKLNCLIVHYINIIDSISPLMTLLKNQLYF